MTFSGVNASPEETVTIVASCCVRRCSMNAAMSRIGPSMFVVTMASATRGNSGGCQSSTRMIPAMVTRTLRSGCSASTRFAAVSMLAASAVSIRTVWIRDARRRSAPAARLAPAADDDGVPLRLQLQRERETDAAGGTGDENSVSGDVHAAKAAAARAACAETACRGIGDPWFGSREARILEVWTVPPWQSSCAATARRCVPRTWGWPAGARRRAKGLRREEVAALAAMSTDYYTRLEQRRGPQPSEQMLAAIARALRLTEAERDYLFQVAGRTAPSPVTAATHVAPALLRVLDRLSDTPALIISNLGETLVSNALAQAIFGDPAAYTGLARSDVYRWFTDPAARRVYPEDDHDRQSRALVANLRAAYGSMGAQSRAGELVRALSATSPEFARLWSRQEVARRFEDHKTLVHPAPGPDRGRLPGPVHRGPVADPAGAHGSPPLGELRETPTAGRPGHRTLPRRPVTPPARTNALLRHAGAERVRAGRGERAGQELHRSRLAPGVLTQLRDARVAGVRVRGARRAARALVSTSAAVTVASLDRNRSSTCCALSRRASSPSGRGGRIRPSSRSRCSALYSSCAPTSRSDPSGLAAYAAAVSDPASAVYHHYLTPAQVRTRFGATQQQVADVADWLRTSGLRVTATTEHYIAVSGRASDVATAFDTHLDNYSVAGQLYRAPSVPPSVPASLAASVLAVTGLDNAPQRTAPTLDNGNGPLSPPPATSTARMTPATISTTVTPTNAPPAPAFVNSGPYSTFYGSNVATTLPSAYGTKQPYAPRGYTSPDLRAAYGATPSETGVGVRVAVIAAYASPTIGQDVSSYETAVGGPAFRPGQFTQVTPTIYNSIDTCGASGWFDEQSLDVEAVHALAPAANVTLVSSASCHNTDQFDSVAEVVDNHLADIVSNSWSTIDPVTSADKAAFEQLLQQGAAEGIGFYAAAGDNGDQGDLLNGVPDLPGSDPWVTSVGGTTLAIGQHDRYLWETGWGTNKATLSADGSTWGALPGTFASGTGGGAVTGDAQPFYQVGVVPNALSEPAGATTPSRVIRT